jgi:uncharacterized membrane protein
MVNSTRPHGKKSSIYKYIALISLVPLSIEIMLFLTTHAIHHNFLFFTIVLSILWIVISYYAGSNSVYSLSFLPFIIFELIMATIDQNPVSLGFAKTLILILYIFTIIVTGAFLLEKKTGMKYVKKKKVMYEDEIKEVLKEFEYLEPPS